MSKPEIVTKYYLKTFDHFSKSFLNCFKLDIFEEKFCIFNIWLNDNMIYVFKSFTENFSDFNQALKNLYMYKSDKKTKQATNSFSFLPHFIYLIFFAQIIIYFY